MKVILAGMPKTGTKTMAQALKDLGYNVYDVAEQFEHHYKDWERIFTYGGTTEDFRHMYENVDAVTDIPAACYWDEIIKAFPNAKIILTMKDSEESLVDSFVSQHRELNAWYLKFLPMLSWTARKVDQHFSNMAIGVFSCVPITSLIGVPALNTMQMLRVYRRHNAHILQNAPKDKLLVFSLKEGWGPLCEFLGKEIPKKPFPHKNKRGTKVHELVPVSHPIFRRVLQETVLSVTILTCAASFCAYKLYKAESVGELLSESMAVVGRVWNFFSTK